MLWFRPDTFARKHFATQRLIALGAVSYVIFSIRSVTSLGWDSDTGLLLELPRTNAPNWYETFATTAHPFGLLVQHVYLDLAEIFGVSDVVAWKCVLGGCVLIQALYIRRMFGWNGLNLFFFTLTTFPSLWRNLLSLEEEIIGMTLFMCAVLGLIRTALDEELHPCGGEKRISNGEIHLKIPARSTIIVATAACLWHFQYWYVLSCTTVCLALWAFAHKGRSRKALFVWATLTALYLPMFHIFGIIRSTPYHEVFSSLPKHVAAGGPIDEWFSGVVRCLFWHGEPYVNDGALPFVVAALTAFFLVGRIFFTRRFRCRVKALVGILLAASFSLPALYEPTSSERWLPFWTIVSACGVTYSSDRRRLAQASAPPREEGPTEHRPADEFARVPVILLHRPYILHRTAILAIITLNAATWHGNFSTSHLKQWSEAMREERCEEDENANISSAIRNC